MEIHSSLAEQTNQMIEMTKFKTLTKFNALVSQSEKRGRTRWPQQLQLSNAQPLLSEPHTLTSYAPTYTHARPDWKIWGENCWTSCYAF